MFRVGGKANFSVCRYQHVGIPSANGFALQWNIGFAMETHSRTYSNIGFLGF